MRRGQVNCFLIALIPLGFWLVYILLPGEITGYVNSLKSLNRPDYSFEGCKAKNDIYFAKTHKTGSSTVASILWRYLDLRPHLKAVTGRGGDGGHTLRATTDKCWVRDFLSGDLVTPPYNLLMNHMVYSPNFADAFMPSAAKVTIVRDPVTRFVSSYTHYGLYEDFPEFDANADLADVIPTIVDDPALFDRIDVYGHAGNQMTLDFGGKSRCKYNDKNAVAVLDDFDLVMVMERMDESLVLLQHLMCWNTSDVLYFKMKAQNHANPYDYLTDSQVAKIRERFKRDVDVYNRGVELFDAKLDAVRASLPACGTDELCFDDYVRILQENVQLLSDTCAKREYPTPGAKRMCNIVSMDAGPYMDRIREEQQIRYPLMRKLTNWTATVPALYIEKAGFEPPKIGMCPNGNEGLGCG